MGENTAFGLGFLQALGRTALTDRERRKREEREQSDRDEEMNSRKLSTLQKMVEAEDLLPDSARNVAAMHAFRLATSDKTKPKDYETAMSEILSAASQPRPSQSPQSLARESARKIGTDPTSLAGWNAIAPMSNMGGAVEDEARRLPEPEMVSGILTRDEVNSRNDLEFMRRLAMQEQFKRTNDPKVIAVEGPDGIYKINPTTGAELGFTPFRTPAATKPPAMSDFEGFLDRKTRAWQAANPGRPLTPDVEVQIAIEARKQFGQADDQPRVGPQLINGVPASMFGGAAVWDSPNGPTLVFPRLMNPNAEAIVPLNDKGVKPQPKDYQSKAYGFYTRAKRANDIFDSIDSPFFKTSMLGQLWIANGPDSLEFLQTEFGRKYRQAQREFTEARLRKESGAAIPPQEFENDRRMYFPAAGDSEAVLAQKRAGRTNIVAGLQREGQAAAPFDANAGAGAGANPSAGVGGTASPQIGSRMRTRDGRTIIVKALSPDGRSVTDYEVVP